MKAISAMHFSPRRITVCRLAGGLLLAVAATRASAQKAPTADRPSFPTAAQQWLNSSPLTYEGLQGKAALLWYFEERCPKCAGTWPALKKLAAEQADQPIIFIGVNSGTSPAELSAYLAKHDIDWPVIADADRAFESASGVKPISLQNIYQVRVVKPDGTFATGRWNDLSGTVEKILPGAKWKVNYDAIPADFHAAARRMEFGDFRPASAAIRQGEKSKSPEIRKTAALMQRSIERRMESALAEAIAGLPADDAWAQFEARQQIAHRFAPHALPKKIEDELSRLSKDPAVQKETRAARALAANVAALASPDESERRRAAARMQRVIDAYPDTRSAAEAKKLLEAGDAGTP